MRRGEFYRQEDPVLEIGRKGETWDATTFRGAQATVYARTVTWYFAVDVMERFLVVECWTPEPDGFATGAFDSVLKVDAKPRVYRVLDRNEAMRLSVEKGKAFHTECLEHASAYCGAVGEFAGLPVRLYSIGVPF